MHDSHLCCREHIEFRLFTCHPLLSLSSSVSPYTSLPDTTDEVILFMPENSSTPPLLSLKFCDSVMYKKNQVGHVRTSTTPLLCSISFWFWGTNLRSSKRSPTDHTRTTLLVSPQQETHLQSFQCFARNTNRSYTHLSAPSSSAGDPLTVIPSVL